MMQVFRGLWLASVTLLSLTAWFLLTLLPVAAHDGVPLAPADLMQAWPWDPLLMAGLATVAWLYSQGVKIVWWRSGVGQGITPWQALAFNGGLTVLFLAFISPLDALSRDLFIAHMAQHLLLILVAAPLLVFGNAPVALAWALPKWIQRRWGYWWRQQSDLHLIGRLFLRPSMIWGVHLVALWLWQVPYVYKVARHDPIVHVGQHGVFLVAAMLFWQLLLSNKRNDPLPIVVTLRFVATTALAGVLLGLLITFVPTLWYPVYTPTALGWGLTAVADQQMAGVILASSMGLVYFGITAAYWRTWRDSRRAATSQQQIHLANAPVQ